MILSIPGIAQLLLFSGGAFVIALAMAALMSLAAEAYGQRVAVGGVGHLPVPHLRIPHTVPLDWVREFTRTQRR
jgi:hypothetical protein